MGVTPPDNSAVLWVVEGIALAVKGRAISTGWLK